MHAPRIRAALVAALALAATAGPAGANLSSLAETSWVTDGEVDGVVKIDGTVYLGGTFTYVGPYTGPGAVVAADGVGAREAGWPLVEGGQVLAVAPDGSGGWFIGGDFTKVGGQSRPYLAHIRNDSTVDAGWNPAPNDAVRSMVVSGSTLYVGGEFTQINAGADNRSRLAAISTTTGVPRTDWIPSANDAVLAMDTAVVGGTTYIVIGGRFTSVNSDSHRRLARVRAADGAVDVGWEPIIDDDEVFALTVAGSTVWVGGSFDSAEAQSQPRNGLAAFSMASSSVLPFRADVAGGFVYALAHDGSRLFVGGGFTQIGGQAVAGVASLNPATAAVDPSWAPQPSGGFARVNALEVSGTDLLVGGEFDTIGGQPHKDLAKLDRATGAASLAWDPNVMRDDNTKVSAVAVQGTRVYVGGVFRSIGGVDRAHLAAVEADSGAATAWNPGADGPVRTLAVAENGTTIYAGGSFSTVAGQAHANLVGLTTAGTTVTTPDANGPVYAMEARNGRLYVGGAFTTLGGVGHLRLGAVTLADGTVAAWSPYVDAPVAALAVTDTRVYVGGNFGALSGTSRPNLGAVTVATGELVGGFNPQPIGSVNAIVATDAVVYAGGDFASVGASVVRHNLAAFDPATGQATTWVSNTTTGTGAVHALELSGTTLFVGGRFAAIDSQPRNRLAAVSTATGDPTSWNPNVTGTGAFVDDILVTDGKVFVGGRFSQIGVTQRSGLGVFVDTTAPPVNDVPPAITGTPVSGQVLTCTNGTWSGGASTFTRQWRRNGADVVGQTGTTYAVQVSDVGQDVSCRVRAVNGGGQLDRTSNAVTIQAPGGGGGGNVAPAMTAPPSITGEARVGSALTCANGSWTGTPAPGYTRSWVVNGVVRSTAAVYVPVAADAGQLLRCWVTATNSVGSANAPAVSVTVAATTPVNIAPPALTGTPKQGSALACSAGTWSGETAVSRQWLRDGAPIAGATNGAYLLTASDAGHSVQCRATAVNGSGTTEVDSVAVTVVGADVTPPTIITPTPEAPTPPTTPTPTTPTTPVKPAKPTIATASVRAGATGVVALSVRCPAACSGRLQLLVGTKAVATGVVKAAAGKTVVVRVRLAAATLKQLRQRGKLQARAVATLAGGVTISRAVLLRR